MSETILNIKTEKHLADLYTPVKVYLSLRKFFPKSLLLESTDYDSPQNSFSIICVNPVSEFIVKNGVAKVLLLNGDTYEKKISHDNFLDTYAQYKNHFKIEKSSSSYDGFFGYISWDAIPYFENISLNASGNPVDIPEIRLAFYQQLIVFDHYHNQMEFISYEIEGHENITQKVKELIRNEKIERTIFEASPDILSNITDHKFKEFVAKGKDACYRGDVFQIVPSRQFQRSYDGDDFNLYRSLRAINPSPYLFYFDYGDFHIMGSSPEAQLVIKDNLAYIDPIAGTFKRTHDPKKDAELADALKKDPKETAEHIMLVDLARNDLSRNSTDVKVKDFKQVHYFSHVLHMISRVTAQIDDPVENMKIFGDTFPAGTLSGAPKYKAIQLIDEMENQNRAAYGGALGFFGLAGDLNTAIIIRSFVSQNGVLYSQAGAGVVSESIEEKELEEVNHKLGALNQAVELAVEMNRNKITDI